MFAENLSLTINRFIDKTSPYLGAPLLAFEYVIFCVYVGIKQKGGFANLETYTFLPAHLTFKGSLLAHVFNARLHDNMGHQNRNVSFFVDYCDAEILGWLLRHGYATFLSPSHFIGVAILLIGLWYIFRNLLRLPRPIPFLLCTLLLLTPSLHTTASYSRSAKIGAGIEVMILATVILKIILKRPTSRTSFGFLWIAALICSFFDLIAISFCLYFFIISLALIWLNEQSARNKRMLNVAAFFVPILLINQMFARYALPAIHAHFFGARFFFPPFPAEHFHDFLSHPISWFSAIGSMFVDQIRFYAGTFPFGVAILFTLILLKATYLLASQHYGSKKGLILLGAFTIPLFGIWFLLKLGHEPVFYDLFRRMYYPVPFQVLIALGFGALIQQAGREYGRKGFGVAAIGLWLAVLGSVSSLDGHIDVFRRSYIAQEIAVSPKILDALRRYARTTEEKNIDPQLQSNLLYRELKKYIDNNR